MTAILTMLAAKAAPFAIAGGALLLSWLGFYVRGRLSGAKLERQKQAASEAKAKTVADEIDDAVAGRSPNANRDALKDWSPR